VIVLEARFFPANERFFKALIGCWKKRSFKNATPFIDYEADALITTPLARKSITSSFQVFVKIKLNLNYKFYSIAYSSYILLIFEVNLFENNAQMSNTDFYICPAVLIINDKNS